MCHVIERFHTVDYHTGGEAFRIVVDGVPPIEGANVAEQRIHALNSPQIDGIRKLLCGEPRGHADMYGGFIVPAGNAGSDFGVVFWHNDGYPVSCGHGTMALAAWAVQSGRVRSEPDGVTTVTFDAPAGQVTADVQMDNGAITGVVLEKAVSYPVARSIDVVTSMGPVAVDLSFGGALFASVEAAALGLAVIPEHYAQLIRLGGEVKSALNSNEVTHRPEDERLNGVFGTVIFDDLGDTPFGPHQRSATVFSDGWVDRSPCGSGTAARMALLADSGQLRPGQMLTHDSIIGTRFIGRIRPAIDGHPLSAIIPEVEGMAHKTGEHTFTLDPADSLPTGFVLR